EQPLERRAALAERALGGAGLGEPDRLLGPGHRDRAAAAQRRARDEEGDRDLLAVLHPGGEIDEYLAGHLRPPGSTNVAAFSPKETDFMTYLVTGAYGALGAWVVRALLDREQEVVTYDLGGSDHRLRLSLTGDE